MPFDRKKVSVNNELTVHPAEHQVFLSFNDDEDAIRFNAWLNVAGWAAFEAWLKAHPDD